MTDTSHIWYSFGVRAKQLLIDVAKQDLDNFDVKQHEYLQVACGEAVHKLDAELAQFLKDNPDE